VHQLRRLTRNASYPCVVACSGGLDSSALLLALAASALPISVGHVVHDMRALPEALADRDQVQELAGALNLQFHERHIAARPLGGNLEAASRLLRYQRLLAIATEASARFVATAHHADDQAETVLMRLLRGSGPEGLRAIRSTRPLSPDVTLIRPALDVTREDLRSICVTAGLTWREDATNADTSHLRARIRHELLPLLRRISPGSPKRIARFARVNTSLLNVSTPLIQSLLAQASHTEQAVAFSRESLRSAPSFVTGSAIRTIILTQSPDSSDRIGHALVDSIQRAIRDTKHHRREFRVGSTVVRVDALEVAFLRQSPDTLTT
jgi:tRNA(Ile)-lysidine synthetase-like protein